MDPLIWRAIAGTRNFIWKNPVGPQSAREISGGPLQVIQSWLDQGLGCNPGGDEPGAQTVDPRYTVYSYFPCTTTGIAGNVNLTQAYLYTHDQGGEGVEYKTEGVLVARLVEKWCLMFVVTLKGSFRWWFETFLFLPLPGEMIHFD